MFEVWVNGYRVASFATREDAQAYVDEQDYDRQFDDVGIKFTREEG